LLALCEERAVGRRRCQFLSEDSYAIDAGQELVRNYGFLRLAVRDPYAAPSAFTEQKEAAAMSKSGHGTVL